MKIALLVLLAAIGLPAAAQTMEPGEWQFTSTLSSSVMPQPQTSVSTQCVSKEDAQDPTRFSGAGQAKDCKVTPGARSLAHARSSIGKFLRGSQVPTHKT